ncbi:efflux RND transporter periplasmic adaptor subunit [Mariniblastus fucicola]|uniref:Cobalt-zinc-cadmium resistance protein CzcB n=1 Tax=Mariniblastus fucicola TaxID=980251 RepID=A0A5B9PEQ6_9BACT|nr:efflux RND transporter periplasmic adaptor subunit [Mariniblastus fucicola]QEG24898.1 Cobalt-zinc-cadmium resistance protein CzcB [Mariniblastus fucicola]
MSNPVRSSRLNWSPFLELLQRFGSIITVAAIAVFGFWGGHFLLPGQEHADSETESAEAFSSVESSSLTLPEAKSTAADLKTMAVKSETFQAHKAVPGTIVYDATKKVELRATVDCVVKETLVCPAQQVEQGQPMLRLTGPAVGAARSEISQCESSVGLLESEYTWTQETHSNIRELLSFLEQSPSSEQARSRFENKNLGEHRNEILSAYAELALAKQLDARTNRLQSQGAISGKEADKRKSGLDVASAKFNSIREEMTFQTSQQLVRGKANLEAEKKQLEMCREKLAALLGPQNRLDDSAKQGVADFVVTAPRSGQIVSLPAVSSSRFEPGEVMAEIADISDVWVEAQISQRDWHSLRLDKFQTLSVRVPALPNTKFTAVVKHIGTSVSESTMAIPLVAELGNPEGRFRPGMSVWVELPTSNARAAMAVPEGAVQRNESESFVFVQTGERTFEKRDVVVGEQSEDRIEIKSGINSGDKVVVEGAFFLKSELLLAEEE